MLSQTAEYALRATVFLGREHPRTRTTREIAAATAVPSGYLAKILQALCRKGVIRSQRGVGGGFGLRHEPRDISVLDVLDAVDPIRRIRACPLHLEEHREQLCSLHQRLDDALAWIEDSFRQSTLEEIIYNSPGVPAPLNTSCDDVAARANGECTCLRQRAATEERPAS
jgi:Rrf2 family transcriptional regulator, nitric oxide-sensitive transcriptional repressor